MSATPTPRGYLPTLDGWRAIAILGVMIAHGTDALLAPGAPYADQTLHVLTRYGARGVDLFFGISGFLICSRLLEEYADRGDISLKGFYIRRFLRILPPYLIFLVVIAVLADTAALPVSGSELLYSATFLRNYWVHAAEAGWYTAHLWSLAIEEHFYLIWPALLVALRRRRAILWAAGLALAIAVWRYIVFHWPGLDPFDPALSRYERTDIRFDGLLWGCVLALAFSRPGLKERLSQWLRPPTWTIACGALVLVIVFNPPFALLWQAMLIPLVLAGTVLHPRAAAGRLLESAPARWVGRISYSLYLWQQLFLVAFGITRPLGAVQQLPLSIAMVFICASLSYYFVERPMIRFGHKLAPPTTEGRR